MLLDIRNQFEYDIGHFNQVRMYRVKKYNLHFFGYLSPPIFITHIASSIVPLRIFFSFFFSFFPFFHIL